ncbi:MAG TPA: LysR family transcriptional regulator [Alphaproteobacteria bacterium]|jgi:molybdate transport system regulatory protein|nr:LysR family transcriptional regulator [Alphaproteobacteria bacterium]
MAEDRLRLRIIFGTGTPLGPGKADLLAAIGRTGSISAAGRELGMSYRRAWILVQQMNDAFRGKLVTTGIGGRRGGGARLTVLGADVLKRYRAMETRAADAITSDRRAFARLLAPSRMRRRESD